MAQSFTDDWYEQSYNAATAFANAENNDTALKSNFSGGSAPSNLVAFQAWGDTSNHIFKLRNEDNDGWESVYDMANSRCPAALNAVNCSRSVTGSSGLSGGGVLSSNQTITHASHTGQVTGSTALTIATDVIDPANCYNGSLQIINSAGSITIYGSGFTEVARFHIKCPSDPTAIRFYLNAKEGTQDVQLKATVVGIGDSNTVNLVNTYAGYDLGTVSMGAATPGTIYAIIIQANGGDASHSGVLRSISAWWE